MSIECAGKQQENSENTVQSMMGKRTNIYRVINGNTCDEQYLRPEAIVLQHEVGSIWYELLVELDVKFKKILLATENHVLLAVVDNLFVDHESVNYVVGRIASVQLRLKELIGRGLAPALACNAYRLMIQEYSFLKNCLTWCSASSDQSGCVMFFDPRENTSSAVNYERYGSLSLREAEQSLLQGMGFNSDTHDLLLTSSGQAAYTVIESFLLDTVLFAGTRVVTSPYIYFEAQEQLKRLKHIELICAESWGLDEFIDVVNSARARVFFIDPMANNISLDICDFKSLAKKIELFDWRDKWLVIDGTMVSGGMDVFTVFNAENHPSILYYESGTKYLQLGLDLQMLGVVVASKKHISQMSIHRRNTGTVLYQSGVGKFPVYSRELYLRRMSILSDNAQFFKKMLLANSHIAAHTDLSYPSNWFDLGWKHGGCVVALKMKNEAFNDRVLLELFIDVLLQRCRECRVPITKGVSYGFITTRVSATAMADDMPSYLRFSIGEEDSLLMERLTNIIVSTLSDYLEQLSFAPEALFIDEHSTQELVF